MTQKVTASNTQRDVLSENQYLSDEQLRKLLRYVKKSGDLARRRGSCRPIINELIILIMTNTGLRAKELLNLNIRDVCTTKSTECYISIRKHTGRISRKMAVPEKLAKKLRRFIELYRKGAKKTEPLFLSEQGNRIGYVSIYNKVKIIGKKSGIGTLRPNMLRHTFLFKLYKAERDLKLLQERGGYSSPQAANIYANTFEAKRKK